MCDVRKELDFKLSWIGIVKIIFPDESSSCAEPLLPNYGLTRSDTYTLSELCDSLFSLLLCGVMES